MKDSLTKAEMTDYLLHIDINCAHRLDKGAEEYGHDGFMRRDNFKDIKEELYDFINYAKFQLIKVMRLESDLNRLDIEKQQEEEAAQPKEKNCNHLWVEMLDSPIEDSWVECDRGVERVVRSLDKYFTCAYCGAKKVEEITYVE